ncbi:MAG TPA: tRNA-binding protein [Saprospiraceae bacterium]|jgi:tRNA-binding protein|nr:tRNA-binding protein [Saprospiraceae bacterium]
MPSSIPQRYVIIFTALFSALQISKVGSVCGDDCIFVFIKHHLNFVFIMISWADFEKVEMHVGTILTADDFPKAKNPAYKLIIDFGPLGIKKSSAQITKLHNKEDLPGKQIIAVTNFPPKQIADFMSECLVLGVVGPEKEVTLLSPSLQVENGLRIG